MQSQQADTQSWQKDGGPALQLEKTTAHFPLLLPFPLLPHRRNGFSDLCLPITVCFTQHQPSDGITHQHTSDIMNAPAPPQSPDSRHIHQWLPVLCDDRDYGNCAWDGDDAPDDDLIRRLCHNWARGVEVQIGRRRSYGCCSHTFK